MSTAPYLADTEAELDRMRDHVTRARATHSTFAADLDLVDSPSAVRLSWDETRAPRVQGNLVCVLPETQDELDRLDPTTGVRVELDLGYTRQDGTEDVATVADLGLRRVTVDYAANTMTLVVASDEALVVDAAAAAVAKVDTATHAAGIQQLLNQAINPDPDLVASVTGGAVVVDPVTDRWSTVQDLADRLEAAIFDDGLRTWYLRPTPTLATTPDAVLRTGPGGTVLEPEAELARDAWFNYVQLRYRWRNASGADQVVSATAYVTTGPRAITGDAGKRIMLDERTVPTTQAQANAAARAILGRQVSRSRSFSFRAIAAYWLRPGMTVQVTLPGGRPELHLVSSVSFEPLGGTMTVGTRLPDTVATFATTTPAPAIPTDPTPPPTADPTPPARLRYVTEWLASDSRAFRSNGQPNSVLTDRVAQGYNPGSVNGNQQSLVLFAAANSTPMPGQRGETGKTIAQALAGASNVRVQVQLTPTHFWSSQGGTLRVGWAHIGAMPSTFTGAKVRTNQTGCKERTARLVDLTSSELSSGLLAGKNLAVTLGPGLGTDTTYYALVAGHTYATASWRPRVRITYYK